MLNAVRGDFPTPSAALIGGAWGIPLKENPPGGCKPRNRQFRRTNWACLWGKRETSVRFGDCGTPRGVPPVTPSGECVGPLAWFTSIFSCMGFLAVVFKNGGKFREQPFNFELSNCFQWNLFGKNAYFPEEGPQTPRNLVSPVKLPDSSGTFDVTNRALWLCRRIKWLRKNDWENRWE